VVCVWNALLAMKLKGKWASFIFGLKGQAKKAQTASENLDADQDRAALLEGDDGDAKLINKASENRDEPIQDRTEGPTPFEAVEWPNIGTLPTIEEAETFPAQTSTESGRHVIDHELKVIDHELKVQEMGMEHDDRLIVNYTKLQLTQCDRQLKEFMQLCPGVYGALISTVDGHELLYTLKRDLPAHKISTMNSSLLALGESIARESQQRLCQFVILENSDGRVVSLRVNDLLMLTCISSKEINLGMLLSVGRNTASKLQEILSD